MRGVLLQPIEILPLPQKTAIRLQPLPVLIERMDEPVRSAPTDLLVASPNTWYICPLFNDTVKGICAGFPPFVLATGVISTTVLSSVATTKK